MEKSRVYVGLGGNIGDTHAIFRKALELIQQLPVSDFAVSRIYLTTPVSRIPQNDYLNAVCRFETMMTPFVLLEALQEIETKLGKIAKPKEAPRVIDLDILLFGNTKLNTEKLAIPHPRIWGRLFVLKPLSDLDAMIEVPTDQGIVSFNLSNYLKSFNLPEEAVILLPDVA